MKTTSHVLELQFKDELGKATKISIKNPTQGVNAETAKASLETISQQKVFRGKNGLNYHEPAGARYVTRQVDTIYQTN